MNAVDPLFQAKLVFYSLKRKFNSKCSDLTPKIRKARRAIINFTDSARARLGR